ncbi:hypothetical protein ACKTG8_004203 [Cronobacter sakazakii]|uniref:hypothetical protein n=1 Tax=Cronobacter sakazakii TaxID=28141 RepID=UPI0006D214C1|nr:hypothetical protein [Cronobacter sakazakii]MDK1063041.1 hypothetical protein [Cronobacter sakazakii]MDK1079714.1 hypothetical protein [Cronobacter sakazakii]MDK1331514.1 hypothetical protein [Cronobacter sakazakii]MDQ9206554.1 hypothetical protein [Cronobacter sakazakii]MDT3595113.1 hypothetical protein [Cronobacter sakazakii]
MINDKLYQYALGMIPNEFQCFVKENKDCQSSSYISNAKYELRIMKVHRDNAKITGLKAKGLDDLISVLEVFDKENVCIINIRSKLFSFKIYSDENNTDLLGVIVLKLRKKSDEEIHYGKEVLGIKTAPPEPNNHN